VGERVFDFRHGGELADEIGENITRRDRGVRMSAS